MEEDEIDVIEVPACKWNWALVPFSILATASGIFDQIAQGLGDLSLGVARHMSFVAEQEQFAREAGYAIERITQE